MTNPKNNPENKPKEKPPKNFISTIKYKNFDFEKILDNYNPRDYNIFPNKGDFRIPRIPEVKKEKLPKKEKNRKLILSPLDEVFFEAELMDDLIVRTSIPQLLDEKLPIYSGVILFGPPGTGKSEFQKALCKVYETKGAYAKQISSSNINSKYVSQLAKNLESELETASEQGETRGLPSLLSFDEGSILAEQAKQGANSVSKHYQEAIDVLKTQL